MAMYKKPSPRWVLLSSALGLTSLMSAQAHAQTRDPAAAQALFDQGRALSREGRYSEACPKFLESNKLDPGIGTEFHLAECYQQSGQIATAWATFLDVASMARSAGQSDREKAANRRALQLEPRLPKLLVNVPTSSQVPGLEVRRDGVAVGTAQWGTAVPVDPGDHELVVTAPGYKAFRRTMKLEEGKPLSVDVPALESDPAAMQAAAPAAPTPRTSPAPQTPDAVPTATPATPTATERRGSGAWPLALAGAGVVGLAVGTVFALKAKSTDTESKQDCDVANPNLCGATGQSQRSDALSQGNVATVAFIAGGAFIAASGLVWLLEPRSVAHAHAARALQASASVVPGNATLYVQGSF